MQMTAVVTSHLNPKLITSVSNLEINGPFRIGAQMTVGLGSIV